jgi:hypothetical protein
LIYSKHVAEEDLSLYAVRALEPNRNAEVQRHLDSCVKCRSRLAEIIGGLSLLTLTASSEEDIAHAKEVLLSRLKAEAKHAAASEPVTEEPIERLLRNQRDWTYRLGWVLAAAMTAFALYLGERVHVLGNEVTALRAQILQISERTSQGELAVNLLNSTTAFRIVLTETKTAAKATAQVIYDKDRSALIFIASNLRPLPANQYYLLWLIPAEGLNPIRTGTFRPDASGNAHIVLPSLPEAVAARTFGVTVEKNLDTQEPASPFVLGGQ